MTRPWLSASPSHDTINMGCVLAWQGRERRRLWLEWFSAEGDAPSITSLPREGLASPGKPTGTWDMGLAGFLTPQDGLKGLGRAGGYFMGTPLLKEHHEPTPGILFGLTKPLPAPRSRSALGRPRDTGMAPHPLPPATAGLSLVFQKGYCTSRVG